MAYSPVPGGPARPGPAFWQGLRPRWRRPGARRRAGSSGRWHCRGRGSPLTSAVSKRQRSPRPPALRWRWPGPRQRGRYRTDALKSSILADLRESFLSLLSPDIGGDKVEMFGGKGGGSRPGARFSAFCAASMTSVPEPQKGSCTRESRRTAQVGNGGGQRLLDGGQRRVFTVAALMQTVAGGVEVNLDGVLAQGESNLVQGTVLGQGADLVALHQPLDDGFLTMLWQAGTLESWLDRLEPLTGKAALAGSSSSHAIL